MRLLILMIRQASSLISATTPAHYGRHCQASHTPADIADTPLTLHWWFSITPLITLISWYAFDIFTPLAIDFLFPRYCWLFSPTAPASFQTALMPRPLPLITPASPLIIFIHACHCAIFASLRHFHFSHYLPFSFLRLLRCCAAAIISMPLMPPLLLIIIFRHCHYDWY